MTVRIWSGDYDYLDSPLYYIYKRNGKSTISKIKKIPQITLAFSD